MLTILLAIVEYKAKTVFVGLWFGVIFLDFTCILMTWDVLTKLSLGG